MTQLDVRHETDQLALLADLSEQAQRYVEASRAESTRATYASDWRIFCRWAAAVGLPRRIPVEPAVIAAWLAAQAPHRRHSTLARSLSAIKYMHAQQGLWSPTDHPQVRATLAGIKRRHPYTKRQARPFYLDDLTTALDALPDSPRGIRNRAILLVGWWGAFRRSELVGLDLDDLTDDAQGVIINLRHSKTDQESQGRLVPLHYHERSTCPVRALRAWTGIIEPEGPRLPANKSVGRRWRSGTQRQGRRPGSQGSGNKPRIRPDRLLGTLTQSRLRIRMRPTRHPLVRGKARYRTQERGDARHLHKAQKPVRIISWSVLLTLLEPIRPETQSLCQRRTAGVLGPQPRTLLNVVRCWVQLQTRRDPVRTLRATPENMPLGPEVPGEVPSCGR